MFIKNKRIVFSPGYTARGIRFVECLITGTPKGTVLGSAIADCQFSKCIITASFETSTFVEVSFDNCLCYGGSFRKVGGMPTICHKYGVLQGNVNCLGAPVRAPKRERPSPAEASKFLEYRDFPEFVSLKNPYTWDDGWIYNPSAPVMVPQVIPGVNVLDWSQAAPGRKEKFLNGELHWG